MDRPASHLALLAQSPSIRLYSQACPGDCPSPQSHFELSVSFHLSLTLFPCVCLSAFLVSASLRPQRLCPFLSWLPLHLSSLCTALAVPRGCRSPCICRPLPPSLNVCLALSSFLISVSLPSPAPCSVAAYPSGPGPSPHSPAFTHTWLRPQESGAWRCGGGAPSSPCPLSPRGRSWAAVLGRAVGRTGSR